MTEFSALASAVVSSVIVEPTAALALADYLSERGDERGTRLRRRVKKYEKDTAKIQDIARPFLSAESDTPQRLEMKKKGFDKVQEQFIRPRLQSLSRTLVSYVFRLTSVASGEKTPPETVGGSYILVEPKD